MDGYTDLKLPKPKKSDSEPKLTASDGPRYPYGLRLRLDGDVLGKFPELKRATIDDEITIEAVGSVMEIRKVEGESSSHSIEIQLTGIRFPSLKSDEDDETFDDAADET